MAGDNGVVMLGSAARGPTGTQQSRKGPNTARHGSGFGGSFVAQSACDLAPPMRTGPWRSEQGADCHWHGLRRVPYCPATIVRDLTAELRRLFGHNAFRGPQEHVIQRFLAGEDTLLVMATGEGKSLCYQLPAFVGAGLTVVVSPLIALMDDQVRALQKRGLPATCVHSMLERHERQERLESAFQGRSKLLYVTPERFAVPGFLPALLQTGVARLAIDEAHCLSHWGHDFRPDYLNLGQVRTALGNPPCLALTATATTAVQADIRSVLGMAAAPLVHTGIERPNLFLGVTHCDDEEAKLAHLTARLEQTGGPAIVYCALIQDLLRLETALQRRGIAPLVYHGSLSAHERKSQQTAFEQSRDGLMLATNAFGMGVDKPDIRAILHWQIPRTLEAYWQEVGRAGRDGLSSFCELLYREEDLQVQRTFVEWANPGRAFLAQVADHLVSLGERIQAVDLDTLRATFLGKNRHDGRVETCLRLLTAAGCLEGEIGRDLRVVRSPSAQELATWMPDDKRQNDLMGLLAMVRYASSAACRRQTFREHFAVADAGTPCGTCDVCTTAADWLAAQMPSPKPLPRSSVPTDDAAVRRGDWIEVRGLGLCCVRSVHQGRGALRADVEVAKDLSQRSIDLRRGQWRKIER